MLPDGDILWIVAAVYPSISALYRGVNAVQVLRNMFQLIPGWCIGRSVNEQPVPDGPNPPGLANMETEHPIDVSD